VLALGTCNLELLAPHNNLPWQSYRWACRKMRFSEVFMRQCKCFQTQNDFLLLNFILGSYCLVIFSGICQALLCSKLSVIFARPYCARKFQWYLPGCTLLDALSVIFARAFSASYSFSNICQGLLGLIRFQWHLPDHIVFETFSDICQALLCSIPVQ
jgi:hypothetical protein